MFNSCEFVQSCDAQKPEAECKTFAQLTIPSDTAPKITATVSFRIALPAKQRAEANRRIWNRIAAEKGENLDDDGKEVENDLLRLPDLLNSASTKSSPLHPGRQVRSASG